MGDIKSRINVTCWTAIYRFGHGVAELGHRISRVGYWIVQRSDV